MVDERLSRLAELLKSRSVQMGEFTLSSGRTSHYYIDARRTTMSAEGLLLIGQLGLSAIRDEGWTPSAVGGLTLGADPVAYAISQASNASPPIVNAFTIRKEAKRHGTARRIEGSFDPGDRVVLVEDVVTSGASVLAAADAVRDAEGEVFGVLAVVDRAEGGTAAIAKAGLDLRVLLQLADLGL